MATIGKKKKSSKQETIDVKKTVKAVKKVKKVVKKIKKSMKKTALPKSGYKRVAQSVTGNGYDISNKDILRKYFNKDGSLNKRNLRSNKQREEFKRELAKAKSEIKQLQKEKRELRERQKQERKNAKKRKKQNETYAENGRTVTHNLDTYNDFVDMLDEVYDQVSLLFYDSDQVMQMLENKQLNRDDIKQLMIDINKRKMESLTEEEKQLLEKGAYKISKQEHERLTEEVTTALYLSSKTGGAISPKRWYEMKLTNKAEYYDYVQDLLTDDEIRKYIK